MNPGAAGRLLLLGDHAGHEIPAELGDLGLSPEARGQHIALDIGVAALGERLSAALDATFVAQRYSRLVIDCNRDPARADSVCEVSDGITVPGNRSLPAAARGLRVDEVFAPYHGAIAAELDVRMSRDQRPLVVSLHSFTPVMSGFARPWRSGVLHLGASPFSDLMLRRLRERLGADLVGDNEPYPMDGVDYTIPHHAIARGLDYLELEVRQDQIGEPAGQSAMAEFLGPVLAACAGELA
jgi:predicted N-formylglutamate amidohydrolase